MSAMELILLIGMAGIVAWGIAMSYVAQYAIRNMRRVTANYDRFIAENPPIVMPTFELDDQLRIVGMGWDLGTIESGASVEFAIPRIPKLGTAFLHLTSETGLNEYLEVDFASGQTRSITPAEFARRVSPGESSPWSRNN